MPVGSALGGAQLSDSLSAQLFVRAPRRHENRAADTAAPLQKQTCSFRQCPVARRASPAGREPIAQDRPCGVQVRIDSIDLSVVRVPVFKLERPVLAQESLDAESDEIPIVCVCNVDVLELGLGIAAGPVYEGCRSCQKP